MKTTHTKLFFLVCILLLWGIKISAQDRQTKSRCEEALIEAETKLQSTTQNQVEDFKFLKSCFKGKDKEAKEKRKRILQVIIILYLEEKQKDSAIHYFKILLDEEPGYKPSGYTLKYPEFTYIYAMYKTFPVFSLTFNIGPELTRPYIYQRYGIDHTDSLRQVIEMSPGIQVGFGFNFSPGWFQKKAQNNSKALNLRKYEFFGHVQYAFRSYKYERPLITSNDPSFQFSRLLMQEDQHWGDGTLWFNRNFFPGKDSVRQGNTYWYLGVGGGVNVLIVNELDDLSRLNSNTGSEPITKESIKGQRHTLNASTNFRIGISNKSNPKFHYGLSLNYSFIFTNITDSNKRYDKESRILNDYGYVSPDLLQHHFSLSLNFRYNKYIAKLK